MIARIVKCQCDHQVYMGGGIVTCPSCRNKIFLFNSEPYMYNGDIPVLNVFKFHSSELKYFDMEYPKNKQEILAIFDDNTSEFFVWKDSFVKRYETTIEEGNVKSVLFSWKALTDKDKRGKIEEK